MVPMSVETAFEDRARGMLLALRSRLPLRREQFEPGSMLINGVRLHESEEHYFGWGHQDRGAFAAAVNTHRDGYADTEGEEAFTAADVHHTWAINLPLDAILGDPVPPGDWRIQWGQSDGIAITEDCPAAFPITVLHL